MSLFNVTIDDSSPTIIYSPKEAWVDSPAADPLISSYSESTFHTTRAPNATVTFTFTGNGIYVFGALRPDHGNFTAQLDGGPVSSFNGFSQTDVAKFTLVKAAGFKMGKHTLVLTNTPAPGSTATGFDLDTIIVQTEVVSSGKPMTLAMDDTAPEMLYSPPSSWTSNDQAFFLNKTSHITQTPGATMTLDFTGEAVAVWGSVSEKHAPYTVTIDGTQSTSYQPQVTAVRPSTLLHMSSGHGPGKHQLVLKNDGQTADAYLDVDYAQVFYADAASGTPAAGGTVGSSGSSTAQVTSSGRGLGGGVIAGIVAGVILVIAILVAAGIFVMMRRRQHGTDTRKVIAPITVVRAMDEQGIGAKVPQRPATRPAHLGDIGPARPARPMTLLLSPTQLEAPPHQFGAK